MTSDNFYKDLPTTPLQAGLCDSIHHHSVPQDWAIVIVDIVGSTKAVAEGRYKDVNIASSCAIIAVLNRVGRSQICYMYGGDGATFLIPSAFKFAVASALYGTQAMARETLGLDMRVGIVDVRELYNQGKPIRIAKVETRPGFFQTALSGTGVTLAETLIKDPASATRYAIATLYEEKQLGASPASFEGFECRWEPLKSRNGIDLCLLIAARLDREEENISLYQEILDEIDKICGTKEQWQPVSKEQLSVSASPLPLMDETKVRTFGKGLFERYRYLARITVLTWTGLVCFLFGVKAGNFDGKVYREETTHNSDFLKFENALKLVMDLSHDKKGKLVAYLESLYKAGKIFYGLHTTESALMTCLVFNYNQDHFHFIDGADGGYTMAATNLKRQMLETA